MKLSKALTAAAGNAGAAEELAEAIDFDGTNDYLSRSTDLVGNADGKTFTFSFWLYAGELGGVRHIYCVGPAAQTPTFQVHLSDNGKTLTFSGGAVGSSPALTVSAGLVTTPNTFIHVLLSVDMSDSSKRHLYIMDTVEAPTWSAYGNTALAFTRSVHRIALDNNGSNYLQARLAHVYLDYTYRDLSVEANRRLFITSDLKPAAGQAALDPILYVPLTDPEDPGFNAGTGGDFTLNGVVARSGRGPNQYNCVASEFDGSVDNLSRASITATDGKSMTFNANIQVGSAWAGEDYILGASSSSRSGNHFSINAGAASNDFEFFFFDASNNLAAQGSLSGSIYAGKSVSLQVSFDLSDTAKRHVLVDGVDQTASVTWTAYDATKNIGWSAVTDLRIGANGGASASHFLGDLGELYFDTTYIDLATSNPFWDADTGKPKPVRQVLEETGNTPLIAMPIRGDDAGNNLGTGGDFTVNSGPFTGARGASEFWARSAEFDGTDGYLSGTNSSTDSKVFTLVFAKKKVGASSGAILQTATTGHIYFIEGSDEKFFFRAKNSGGTEILKLLPATVMPADWQTAAWCVDLTGANPSKLYIDGVEDTTAYSTFVDDFIDFTDGSFNVGGPGDWFDGNIGFLWLNTEYVDFSLEANRLKFFDAFGYPVDIGEDGSTPTGNQPLIYMPFDDTSDLGFNAGSGGDFTVNGTVTPGPDVKG